MDFERLLYLSLSPSSTDEAVDPLRLLPEDITGVIIKLPAWQDFSPFFNAMPPVVQRALDICRAWKKTIVWGRNLWPSYAAMQMSGIEHYSAFYAAALARLHEEAASIADKTLLDCEPYGDSVLVKKWSEVHTYANQTMIRAQVMMAAGIAQQATWITPSSSVGSGKLVWPLLDLGERRMDHKTYRSQPPDWQVEKISPPPYVNHRIDGWGSHVGRDGISIDDARAWTPKAVTDRYPDCKTQMIYIMPDELRDILTEWRKAKSD